MRVQICAECLQDLVYTHDRGWIHRGGLFWQRCACGWSAGADVPLVLCPDGHWLRDEHAAMPMFPLVAV